MPDNQDDGWGDRIDQPKSNLGRILIVVGSVIGVAIIIAVLLLVFLAPKWRQQAFLKSQDIISKPALFEETTIFCDLGAQQSSQLNPYLYRWSDYVVLDGDTPKLVLREGWPTAKYYAAWDVIDTTEGPLPVGRAFRAKLTSGDTTRIVAGVVDPYMIRVDPDAGSRAGRIVVLRAWVLQPATDKPGSRPTPTLITMGGIRFRAWDTNSIQAGVPDPADPSKIRFQYQIKYDEPGEFEVQMQPDGTFTLRVLSGKARAIPASEVGQPVKPRP